MARRRTPTDDSEYTGRRIDHVDPIFGGAAIMGERGGYRSVERTPEEIASWKRHNELIGQRHQQERNTVRAVGTRPNGQTIFETFADHGPASRERTQREVRERQSRHAPVTHAEPAPEPATRRRRGEAEIPAGADTGNLRYSSNRLRVPDASARQFRETGWGGPDQSRVVYRGTSYEAIPRLGSNEIGVYRNPNGRWVQVHPGNNGEDRQGRVSHGNIGRHTEHISAARARELIAEGAVVGKDLSRPRRDRSPTH